MTVQKLNGIPRKAGITIAAYQRSGQVRGWGTWSAGARVTKQETGFKVEYEVGGIRVDWDRARNAMASYIVPALQAAGVQGVLSEDGLTFWVEGE